MKILAAIVLATVAGACTPTITDVGLEDLDLDAVAPDIVLPGTQLALQGDSFAADEWGDSVLRLVGTANGRSIDVSWPARFVDYENMVVEVTEGNVDELGGDVDFDGEARVEVVSSVDNETYETDTIDVALQFRRNLTPAPSTIQTDTLIFVNDEIVVDGEGFLLGGTEGTSFARVSGCFSIDGLPPCIAVTSVEVAMTPAEPFSRTSATFPFKPGIAGIRPGSFTGEVTIINRHDAEHGTGEVTMASELPVYYDLIESQVNQINPTAASLGQYVFVEGGGFVGGEAGASTELRLQGTFMKAGAPGPVPVDITLIPEYVKGTLVRYVINEDDTLGQSLDLRQETGSFSGTITPEVTFQGDTVIGRSTTTTLAIAPVKQIVYLDFRPTYVEGLRELGLRAVDAKIRERILAVLARNFVTINIEFRAEPPEDFALFSHVELHGADPNGQGLFGYDNTPGKDDGNIRLYDRLGGVNAQTQQDGYAGYGGVFVKSLFGFSLHPPSGIESLPGADPVFDKIFDPFRLDRGTIVTSSDLAGGLQTLTSGANCPAGDDRKAKIECAIFVLGNLIGGTLAHEIGHSLGLANPYAEGFHNAGDAPGRLMDAGGDRPFLERAELLGLPPGVFCDEEYTYLRSILPTSDPDDTSDRPTCY